MLKYFLIMILCLIPSVAILYYIYYKDKIEKEPMHLLFLLFVEGVVCCVIAYLIAGILGKYIPYYNLKAYSMNIFQIVLKNLVFVAAIEEFLKWIINYTTIWKNKNFDHIYDPIVYSTFISIGFATYECIVYGLAHIDSLGFIPIIMKSLMVIPIHAVLGIFMGYYLGLAKQAEVNNNKRAVHVYRFYSIIFPILFHFIYKLCFVKEHYYTFIMFIIFLIVLYWEAISNIKELSEVRNMLDGSEKKPFDLPKMKDEKEEKKK